MGLGLKIFVLFILGVVHVTAIAEKKNYTIPRVVESPIIDGVIDKTEWQNATQVELAYETNPGDNLPAPVRTIAYMMEDGENLYFAFKAYDPHPEKILAYLRDRDQIFQDDFVGVIIDTFNDERRGFEFFVNPLGAQGDLTRDDSRFNEDSSWDTVWESFGQVNEDGYVVEVEIPFRALRFQSGLKEQTWGINFLRIYPRESRSVFSDIPLDRNLDCTLCQVDKVKGMPNLEMGSNIDVTPTLTSIKAEGREPESNGDWQELASDTEVGLDVRWALSENWIVNATLNPDFSQIDADAGQLDINTTFSLFFPESRPFFLDGADYFATRHRLVHTRNIADPDFGLKLTGKSDGNSAGIIAARDSTTSFLIPRSFGSDIATLEGTESDVLIARYQRDIGDKSNIGALVTRRGNGDYQNTVTSADGKYYFSENDSVEFQFMHSESTNPQSVQDDFGLDRYQSDNAYSISLRRSKERYGLNLSYRDFGKDFRADLGFVGQVDYKKLIVGGNYTWYGEKDNPWTRWGFFGDWDKTEDQSGQTLEEESELHFNLNGPKQFYTNFGAVIRNRFYDGQFFDENRFKMYFEFKPWDNLTFGNFMLVGDQIDFSNSQLGDMQLFEPFVNWQVGKHFNIRVSLTDQKLNVPGGQLFSARLYDTRLAYQFDIRSRLSLTLQGTDIDRNQSLYLKDEVDNNTKYFGTQLIYSYKINPLSLVYLGYSDNARNNDDLDSLQKSERTVFAKFSYMWQY